MFQVSIDYARTKDGVPPPGQHRHHTIYAYHTVTARPFGRGSPAVYLSGLLHSVRNDEGSASTNKKGKMRNDG